MTQCGREVRSGSFATDSTAAAPPMTSASPPKADVRYRRSLHRLSDQPEPARRVDPEFLHSLLDGGLRAGRLEMPYIFRLRADLDDAPLAGRGRGLRHQRDLN